MSMIRTRAGLMLGVLGILCALSIPGLADDLRPTQVLVESGIFLPHTETEAAFVRLDAPRPEANLLLPKLAAYWESGAASYGQAGSSRRVGSGGSTTQMRLGAERNLNGAIVGASVSAGFGGVGSDDFGASAIGRHADVYGRVDRGVFFTKLLLGGSMFDFSSIRRGAGDAQAEASTMSYGARAATQFGATLSMRGVKITPTIALAAYASRLSGYDECGGPAPLSFDARGAAATLASVRVKGSRSFDIGQGRNVELHGFLGAEGVAGYEASRAKAETASGEIRRIAREAAPSGRGVVGGLGVGTTLAPGVSMTVDYDYGLRDSVSTHSSRAKLGVAF